MKSLFRIGLPGLLCLLVASVLSAAAAEGQTLPLDAALDEAPGADIFVTPREALLREKPAATARVISRLSAGTRGKLLDAGERFLHVEVPPSAPDSGGPATGYLAREVTASFRPGREGTRDLATVGRILARSETNRRLAAAFLMRAAERAREAGEADARLEVLLGETAEELAAAGGPFPPGLEVVQPPGSAEESTRYFYRGKAFERALELTSRDSAGELSAVRDRAMAGLLRARYPETSASLTLLWQETAGWLQLAESACDPAALSSAADRLGIASLALGRYLLATGKLNQIEKIEERVRAAGGRVAAALAHARHGRKLLSRAEVLKAMRGDGSLSFPQEARSRTGAKEHVVAIEGKLGSLVLSARSCVGSAWELPRRLRAVPILPVPGSLRVSRDGKSAAWIEVAGPSSLLPVMVSIEKDEPAREVAFLASGRPLRDRGLEHVLSSVGGFSTDGSRLGLSILAWNETPGPEPRLSVVSVATGELLYETSKDKKAWERLLQ